MPAVCLNCGGRDWSPWDGTDAGGRCVVCTDFPTLAHEVADFIQGHCVIPDRATAGQAFLLSPEQYNHLMWQFRLRPDAVVDPDRPAQPFHYVGSVLVRSQKWGKGPFSAARICAQAAGPVLFAGWDADGQPVGMQWATPHIQVAAVAEDQTDNIWRALKPMIERSPALHALIPDTGLERINLPGGGIIEPVTSAALTRLGARLTYVELDEPHLMTARNGGHKLADTMRRNIAGMGGRWAATGNAYDPSEQSVEQTDVESRLPDVFVDFPESPAGSWGNKAERRRILRFAYKGAPWVDIDRIESDCARLAAKGEGSQAERFFGNRVVSGADAAFDVPVIWRPLRRELEVPRGRLITLGFDGARRQDSTGLVGTDVEHGHQFVVGKWERPTSLHEDDDWEIDEGDVHAAVADAFATWNVWRLYADPPYWETPINAWAGEYGDQRVVRWYTQSDRRVAFALKAWRTAMGTGALSHDGDPDLERHLGNAVKQWTRIRDEPDGDSDELAAFLWVIRKETPRSSRKIDLAMAALLSWEARGDALRAGALEPEPEYGYASW